MSIIIKEDKGEYKLCSVYNNYYNLTPYTKPNNIKNIQMYNQVGYMLDLCGLEVDKEYELDWKNDFEICLRLPKYFNESWGTSDKCFYLLKESPQYKKYVRKLKLRNITNEIFI